MLPVIGKPVTWVCVDSCCGIASAKCHMGNIVGDDTDVLFDNVLGHQGQFPTKKL